MRVLYIASEFGITNGTNTNMMMHYKAIIKSVGSDNVFTVDLNSGGKQILTKKYCAYTKPESKIEKAKRLLQLNTRYMSKRIADEICELIKTEKIEVVFIDDSILGSCIKKIKVMYPEIYVVAFYHDVKKNLYNQWLKERGLSFLKEYIPGLYNEKLTARYADANITLNKRESDELMKAYHKKASAELPVGIESIPREDNTKYRTDVTKILFVGAKYYPNQYGIRWFCENVFPIIPQKCELTIVGRGMEIMREELEKDNIHVIGGVECLTPYYQEADVVIAPIFDGAGMKVKTAEALAYGKRFYATKESLIGYNDNLPEPCRELIVECNTPDEFVRAFSRIKQGSPKWNLPVRKYFEEYYSEEAITKKMGSILRRK